MNKIICPDCGIDNFLDLDTCISCKSNLKLNNKYHLIDVIGENNQITYLAENVVVDNDEALHLREPQASKQVVIKELSIASLDDWKNKELFEREIAVLNSLDHEQIPKLIDNFEQGQGSDKVHYLVMEYIEGISLEDEILKTRYDENEALLLIKELLNILDYLHSFSPPIVHRDIKPSNIIRRKVDHKLVLIDFGAVTEALKIEGGSTVVGTYGYMAPEQFMGKASIQSDYYSLGAIIIKLLTKAELHEVIDISDSSFIDKINVSENMKIILKKLLALDLNQRAKSTTEIIELIKKYTIGANLSFAQPALSLSECIRPTDMAKVGESSHALPENLPQKQTETSKKTTSYPKLLPYDENVKIPEETEDSLIKNKYKQLEDIFLQVQNEDEEKWYKDSKNIIAIIVSCGLGYIDTILILLGLVITLMMIMTSRRKDYERFLNKVSAKGYNIELIFLFLKNNAYRFRISESKINELRYHSKSFDEGQLIVYKDILDGKPVEL